MAVTIKPNKGLSRMVIPDGVLVNAKNGAPTRSAVPAMLADVITARQHEGRPFFHWWGGQTTADDQPSTTALRMLRLNTLEGGCKRPRGIVHIFPGAGLVSTTAGIYCMDGTLNSYAALSPTQLYPDQVISVDVSPDASTDTAVPTGGHDSLTMGSDTVNLASGCLFEDTVIEARPDDVVLRSGYAPGGDILAHQTNSRSTNEVLADRFHNVWQNRRPAIGWSGTGGAYADFTVSSQAFRYIFDQSIGSGGTAPSATGPADTLPCHYVGAGLRNTVRVYVSVYAAMSGATDQGEIAVANKDSAGVMGSMIQVGGAGMISGTVFQWYPATGGTFNPATAPYFESPTEVAFDRVCLGARSTGATDTVRIAAWMMFVYHSVA